MLQKMTEMELELTVENIGHFLKFVSTDVFKEETPLLVENKLEPKDVVKLIQNKARTWYFDNI